MRLMVVMRKIRVLYVALLNVMEVPKLYESGNNAMTYSEGDTAVTQRHKSDIYSLYNNIKVKRECSSTRYNGHPNSGYTLLNVHYK